MKIFKQYFGEIQTYYPFQIGWEDLAQTNMDSVSGFSKSLPNRYSWDKSFLPYSLSIILTDNIEELTCVHNSQIEF